MNPSSSDPRGPAPWEAFGYARTLKSDYCHLAVPEWFDSDSRKWAGGYVKGSRLSDLYSVSNRVVRYFLFKNETYCGVGVTLPASMVFDDESKTYECESGERSRGREVYATLGGVTLRDEAAFPGPSCHPGLPSLDDLKRQLREIFGPLYKELVADRFDEEPPEGKSDLTPIPCGPRVWFPPHVAAATSASKSFKLNQDDDARVDVWPPADEDALWAAACLAEPPVSLCLNVRNEDDALNARFGNVTRERATAKKTLFRKVRPETPQSDPVGLGQDREFKLPISRESEVVILIRKRSGPRESTDS